MKTESTQHNLIINSDDVTFHLLMDEINEVYDAEYSNLPDEYLKGINAIRIVHPDEWFSLNYSWHFDNDPKYLVINGEKVQYVTWGQGGFKAAVFLKFEDMTWDLYSQLVPQDKN